MIPRNSSMTRLLLLARSIIDVHCLLHFLFLVVRRTDLEKLWIDLVVDLERDFVSEFAGDLLALVLHVSRLSLLLTTSNEVKSMTYLFQTETSSLREISDQDEETRKRQTDENEIVAPSHGVESRWSYLGEK